MLNRDKSSVIKDKVSYTDANKYYEILQNLSLNMVDFAIQNNVLGMVETYKEIYILVYWAIEKYIVEYKNIKQDGKIVKVIQIKEEYEPIDDISDISQEIAELPPNNTDYATNIANSKILKIKLELYERRKILSKLMGKANLWLPLRNVSDGNVPAAFSRDGQ